MPPHCDSLDGPRRGRPLMPAMSRSCCRSAANRMRRRCGRRFAAVQPVRAMGEQAQAVADRHFFETVVGIHRAGEGAPYTGLKPAGTPVVRRFPWRKRLSRRAWWSTWLLT
jgi:hypothetical protein